MNRRNLLLLSTSTLHGQSYLHYARNAIKSHFDGVRSIVFFPYARPGGMSHENYTEIARAFFKDLGIQVIGAHALDNRPEELLQHEGIFIGGGNTFVLLNWLYKRNWISVIRSAVESGIPYMGTSAGTNVATLGIHTTNDMPIASLPNFEALGLVRFHINPHYLDPIEGSQHMGETRETRISEFHTYHRSPVVGLREGSWLNVKDADITLLGPHSARIFRAEQTPEEVPSGSNLSFLESASN